jgi:RNA polymerase sigma-70 factor (ECF subfamily)
MPRNEADDLHQLVARVSAGDRTAFLSLYDQFSSRVFGLAMTMLHEKQAAEEVTQETFLKLWTRADTYQAARGAFLTWLLTIARRTALDLIRRESRRPPLSSFSEDNELLSQLPQPASGTEEARWGTVRFAMAELPDEQRKVIALAFYHGLSQSQIAATLDIPLGTVKTRVRLGMEKLRLAFGVADDASDDRG